MEQYIAAYLEADRRSGSRAASVLWPRSITLASRETDATQLAVSTQVCSRTRSKSGLASLAGGGAFGAVGSTNSAGGGTAAAHTAAARLLRQCLEATAALDGPAAPRPLPIRDRYDQDPQAFLR